VFGLLIVGFLEYRDSSLKKEIDVVRTLSLPVLALIPMMASAGERRKAQRRMWALNIAAGIALLGSAAILALWRHGTL